jgi:hypothetical protein
MKIGGRTCKSEDRLEVGMLGRLVYACRKEIKEEGRKKMEKKR